MCGFESLTRVYCYGGGFPGGRHRASDATLPFGRPRSSPLPYVRSTRSTRSFEDRSREPCADFTSARVREAPSCFLRPPICYFSGKGLPCALSHASDSTAAHCYATIAARRHIGTEPKP